GHHPMRRRTAMSAGHSPPRQSATYRAIAGCGGTLAAVVVIGFVWVMATLPESPSPRVTDETQAGNRLSAGAVEYGDRLFAAARGGPLTEAGLAAVPRPDGVGIEVAGFSRQGGTTVVTYSAHARYGDPDDRKEVTACYRVELIKGLGYPRSKKLADRDCSGLGPGSQPNDSASGASGGTRPSAAARVSRPRIAA
ncbi:hypothetical protein ACFU5Z_23875, partial [Streptomyces sp. NPDC057521]|uniref:hypothetical protein n=1 Tax=Streptomyces sp. NPDC057521 TaxID=3346156 RepID=UPI0036A1ADF2